MELIIREGGAARFLALEDSGLLLQCRVDTYIASGPGGQHRNRTYSAVRLVHEPTGISVTGEERRSQHVNKQKAVSRLRMALGLQVRSSQFSLQDQVRKLFAAPGPLRVSTQNRLYPLLCAAVLDGLFAGRGSLSQAGQLLGLSTGQMVKIISREAGLLTAANRVREHFSLKPVKT